MCSPSVVCRYGSLCFFMNFQWNRRSMKHLLAKDLYAMDPSGAKNPQNFSIESWTFFRSNHFFSFLDFRPNVSYSKIKNFQARTMKLYFLSRKKIPSQIFFLLLLRTSINNVWVKITPFLSYPTPLKNTRFTHSESNYVADSHFFSL